jgi:hypothetical protein
MEVKLVNHEDLPKFNKPTNNNCNLPGFSKPITIYPNSGRQLRITRVQQSHKITITIYTNSASPQNNNYDLSECIQQAHKITTTIYPNLASPQITMTIYPSSASPQMGRIYSYSACPQNNHYDLPEFSKPTK